MRATLFCLALAACTPDVLPGSYLCGPEASCPEGQACDGVDDTCVLPTSARPFACDFTGDSEPDDTAEQGASIDLSCASLQYVKEACMLDGDTADWLTFVPPEECTNITVETRLSFAFAWQVLGVELWDLDANMQLATDKACEQGADNGQMNRCLELEVAPGTKYGVKVQPTGEGTCNGDCAYNRYTLTVQLSTPG